MNTDDLITWQQLVKKTPKLITQLPQILDGIKLTREDDPSKPVGLALEFERVAIDNPKGVAILGEQQRLTYSQANRIANQIAHGLKNHNIQKGDVVGIYMENRPEVLLVVLACAKIGAISAMLNTQKVKASLLQTVKLVAPKLLIVGEEITKPIIALQDEITTCEQFVVVKDQPLTNQAPTSKPDSDKNAEENSTTTETLVGWLDLQDILTDQPQTNLESSKKIYLHDPVFYVFTSGTSGMPKAGIFTHGRWMKLYGGIGKLTTELNQHDVLYATMPLYHATALCVCWCSVIAAQAGFAIGRRFSANQFWNETLRFHATAIGYVGDLCQFLLAQPPKEVDRTHNIRLMLGNGLRPAIWSKFKNRFDIHTVYEFYGASDGNVGFFNLLNLDNTVGFSPNKFAIIAVDEDNHQPIRGDNGFFIRVKTGEVGLLISEINTHFPLDGYTEKSETQKIILKNAFETGDRWLNTGDLMRDLGFRHTQFIDRVGDSFRWHGENVSAQEVENVVLENSFVDQAIVYGAKVPFANGRAGMLTMTLQAKVMFHRANRRHFLAYLRTHLPSYAIPRFIRITPRLDTTSTFKVKKGQYQKEGYNPQSIKDDLYVYNLHSNCYEPLTQTVYQQIEAGEFKL